MNSTLILIQTLIAYVGVLIMLTWHIKQYTSHTKSTHTHIYTSSGILRAT